MLRATIVGAAIALLAMAALDSGQAADLTARRAPPRAKAAAAATDCFGLAAPDAFCRHYGYARGTQTYARCTSIIAGAGTDPALSNGYTINFDWTKTLPPRACRPPRLVITPPENRPL